MKTYAQGCPVARTLDIVGDRWTLLVLRDLFIGATRFSDMLERSPGLPPKVLSARLKFLKEHGIVDRRIYSLHPLRAEYILTAKGRSLLPVVLAIGDWGFAHTFESDPEARAEVARVIYDAIPESRPLIEEGGYLDGANKH